MTTSRQLLDKALEAMETLQRNMKPDENCENAIIEPEHLRAFVDTHARLLYERGYLKGEI